MHIKRNEPRWRFDLLTTRESRQIARMRRRELGVCALANRSTEIHNSRLVGVRSEPRGAPGAFRQERSMRHHEVSRQRRSLESAAATTAGIDLMLGFL